jgi:hypothetical protein
VTVVKKESRKTLSSTHSLATGLPISKFYRFFGLSKIDHPLDGGGGTTGMVFWIESSQKLE